MGRTVQADPPGLTAQVKRFVEDPHDPLRDQLAPGEQVVAEFDVFYPELRMPFWKVIVLGLCTFGLFWIVYALWRLYKTFMRLLYRTGCLTPLYMSFVRGKMAVTNQGRAICWKQAAQQLKQEHSCIFCLCKMCCPTLCAPAVVYSVQSEFRHFSMSDLQEVTQVYDSSHAGDCWRAWLCCCCTPSDAAVCLTFGGWSQSAPFWTLRTVGVMQRVTFWYMSLQYLATLTQNVLFRTFGVTIFAYPQVYLISTKHDVQHNEGGADKFQDLQQLVQSITRLMPPRPDRFINTGAAPANFSLSQHADSEQIVDDEGKVSLHPSLLALVDGEQVLEAFGGVYILTTVDWIKIVFTVGIYYICVARWKRFLRTAYVLTNKRLIEVNIFHARGLIPSHYAGFCYTARSFFPSTDGTAGIIRRGRRFASTAVLFGEQGLTLDYVGSGYRAEKIIDKFIAFSHALSKMSSRQEPLMLAASQSGQTVEDPRVPTLQGEALVSYMNEEPQWRPCCFLTSFGQYLCSPHCPPSCFPAMVLCLTCGCRPFKTTPEIFITDRSAFVLQNSRGSTQCCCAGENYVVVYVPVRRLLGTSFDVHTWGHDRTIARCCAGTRCGDFCCPIATATSNFVVYTADLDMPIFRTARGDINLRTDPRIASFRDNVSAIVDAIQAEQNAPPVAVAKEVV